MSNVFIIHGAVGHPEENWFPWLRDELENRGHNVYVPTFPTPEGQTFDNWQKAFEDYERYIDEDSVFVGHSLGPAFILSLLEKYKIKGAYFVAGYHPNKLPKDNEWYKSVKTFIDRSFDWDRIKTNCAIFHVYHSDNDPYFPLFLGEELAKQLGVNVDIVKNAGHFNEAAGYLKFPKLLEDIKNETDL